MLEVFDECFFDQMWAGALRGRFVTLEEVVDDIMVRIEEVD